MTYSLLDPPRRYTARHMELGEARQRQREMNALHEREWRALLKIVAGQAPAQVLEQIYEICARERPRFGLSMILDVVDRWVSEERWADVEATLQQADLARMAPTCVVGLLTATFPVRERLAVRKAYLERAREHLGKQLSVERAGRLLVGLV